MVWALILQPKKKYSQKAKESFCVTMATLDIALADDKPVQVMFISEETKYLLCTLHKNNVWQVPLNFVVEKEDTISFMSIGGYVHLMGHKLKEYDILKEPRQDWIKVIAEQLSKDTMKEQIANGTEDTEHLKTDALNMSNDQEGKKKLKRKTEESSLKVEEVKRIKSSTKSNENDDNDYDKDYEDMKKCDDNDDDNNDNDDDTDTDTTSSLSKDDDSKTNKNKSNNETEVQKQEKNGKQKKQDKQTKEETKREQKDKKKKEKKQENNENNKNTTVIEGGVQVQELKAGTGKIAEPGKYITIYYLVRVQLGNCKPRVDQCLNGIGFRFKLGAGLVIHGVDKGVVGMKVGEKRRLIIPHKMAYGPRGCEPDIPPFSTLIYNVELLKVE